MLVPLVGLDVLATGAFDALRFLVALLIEVTDRATPATIEVACYLVANPV